MLLEASIIPKLQASIIGELPPALESRAGGHTQELHLGTRLPWCLGPCLGLPARAATVLLEAGCLPSLFSLATLPSAVPY